MVCDECNRTADDLLCDDCWQRFFDEYDRDELAESRAEMNALEATEVSHERKLNAHFVSQVSPDQASH